MTALAWKVKACSQSNGFSVLVEGSTVSAYVPNGYWASGGSTGVRKLTVEGPGPAPAAIATPAVVNACAADQTLQKVVCTSNGTDVYVIQGNTLTKTLTDGASGALSFSGGSCTTCTVAVNPITHIAYIAEAVGSGPAIQTLDLRHETFGKPFALSGYPSESMQVDTERNLLLSANESSNYEILSLNENGQPSQEFSNTTFSANYDASGEVCRSGLMMATDEETGNLYFGNIKTAVFNRRTSTWSDPNSVLMSYPEFTGLSAGTSGLAISPSTRFAAIAGEFGGSLEGFMALPPDGSTSSAGLSQYVVAALPDDPSGSPFQNGFDPHSETAYVSPTTGKTYVLFSDWAAGVPDYLASVDIPAILAAPRVVSVSGKKHEVDPSYNLIAHHVVRFIKTF